MRAGGRSDGPGWSPALGGKSKALGRTESTHSSLDRFWKSALLPKEANAVDSHVASEAKVNTCLIAYPMLPSAA